MGWEHARGHDDVRDGFRRVSASGRMAHAYLFTGPAGIGKRAFAVEMARAKLCPFAIDVTTACGTCDDCIQVEAQSHPDFLFVSRPEETHVFPIEVMQKAVGFFSLKPARGRGRAVVIDDADDFNDASANCFLKTLEEPPSGSLILLLGTSPERQLMTIRSRCQVVRFAPPGDELVREVLAESEVTDERLVERVLRAACGSPGAALALADPGLWDFRAKILAGFAKRPLASVELAKEWMAYLETVSKEGPAQRRQSMTVSRLVLDFLADVQSVAQGGRALRTDANDAAAVRAMASRVDAETLAEVIERCMEADEHLRRNVKISLVVEAMLDAAAQRAG